MRNQPIQSSLGRLKRVFANSVKRILGEQGFASAAVLASPVQEHSIAALQVAPNSLFTFIISAFAGLLGLSASLHYRHLHHKEETMRRRAENAEAELRALLMMTDEAVLVLSPDGTIRASNPASEELFGCASEEFLGESLTKVLAQPLALGELTKHGPVNFQTTARRGEGGYAQVEMLLSPVELSGGKGYLALIHEPRAACPGDSAKRTVRKPEFHKAVEEFTHDLNNQLTSVLGNLSLILMSHPGDPATHERVLTAKKTAVRAQALSQRMQSLIRPEEPSNATALETPDMTEENRTILTMPNVSAPSKISPSRSAGPARILILDDEEVICMLVASALDASGFEVSSATSVSSALQSCEEAVHKGTPFSLLICDLSLPGEVHGTQALKQLRAIDPALKAIVSSGYDGDPVMRDCRKHGFNAAMPKPYDINKLVRCVGEVLAGGADDLRKSA